MDRSDDRPVTALLLAAVAGAVDAAGFIMLDGLFLSFMSGNVTRFGLAVADRFWSTAGLAAALLALFVGGVAAGTMIGGRLGARRRFALLLLAALLIGASAWLGSRTGLIGAPTLVIAMGVLNAVFPSLGVTYVTGALVRIGEALGGRGTDGLAFDVGLVVALAAGGLATARVMTVFGLLVLWAPAAALLLAALVHLVPARPR